MDKGHVFGGDVRELGGYLAEIYAIDLGGMEMGRQVARYDAGAAAHVEDGFWAGGADGGVDDAAFH